VVEDRIEFARDLDVIAEEVPRDDRLSRGLDQLFDLLSLFRRPLRGVFLMSGGAVKLEMLPQLFFRLRREHGRTVLHPRIVAAAIRIGHLCTS
jgi:hypothetical protein